MPPSELPSQAEPLKEEFQRDRSCLALITECDENKEEDVGGQRVDALFDGAAAAIPHLSVTGSQRNFDQSKPTRRKARKNPLNNDTPLLKHGLEDLTLSVEEKKEEFVNCQQPDASACVADAVPPVSTTGLCPFRHGTVYAHPYPGYAHGNPKKGVCPKGCRPEMSGDITDRETPKETLVREAMEFLEIYYHERQEDMDDSDGFLRKEERMSAVKLSIDETGTYEHTFDELEYGAQLAWRNAPKCSNRKYWEQLKLLDCREVDTNEGMYKSCLKHISKAMETGSSECYISVFKPAKPGTHDGPRIWNDQLLSYAGYNDDQGSGVIGDPSKRRFTEMLRERFGWDGPNDGKKGRFDYLPLVIQADPSGFPELFELPIEFAHPVHIHHPRYPELSDLELQWYPVPAVSALDLSLGGLVYTAVPLNGWYADTEVLRDLTDETRYNLLVPVAKALGLDTDTEAPYWKDEVMVVLTKAIYYSYKCAKVSIVDHHTLIDNFWNWYRDELKHRKYCPTNWKWVIPPMSSSTNRAYLGLNKAQEYTLKPAYLGGKSFSQLEDEHFGTRRLSNAFKNMHVSGKIRAKLKQWANRAKKEEQFVLIIYASATGNAAKYASELGGHLSLCFNVTFFDACGANAATDSNIMAYVNASKLVIFVTSTQGNGEVPPASKRFFSSLLGKNRSLFSGKDCAVLGFGSSAYPIFCGGAAFLSKTMAEIGANEIVPRGECDHVSGEATAFHKWIASLVGKMAIDPTASNLVLELNKQLKSSEDANSLMRIEISNSVTVHVFSSEEVKNAAGESFLRGSLMKMSNSGGKDGDRRSLIKKCVKESMINGMTFGCGYDGTVMSRDDIVTEKSLIATNDSTNRKTCLIKIDLRYCGSPPYEPGDHVQVFPHNTINMDKLEIFIGHLSGNLQLDDQIFVSFKSAEIAMAELKVYSPLLATNLGNLVRVRDFFKNKAAFGSPISMESCFELSRIATNAKEKHHLAVLGYNEGMYENMKDRYGLKWADLFDIFPSLSHVVTIDFLLCNMKKNHVRSYSIASCKSIVGSELHLIVGRFLFTRGDNTEEIGVCSNYLTSCNPGDSVKFELVSNRSFQHPPHTCPMIFICSGTGFAPIRGLLQKRVYFHNRGEKLGPAYIVFGSRSSNEGTFFQEEIKDFQENGALTEAFLCYSREPGQKKEYTADKLRTKECEDILGPLLGEKDTHIFLCGSANMAEECKSAFREMSSPSCFDAIENEHRIHCDVFGALSSANTRKKIGVTRKQTRSRRRSIGSFVMSSENELLLGLKGTRKSK